MELLEVLKEEFLDFSEIPSINVNGKIYYGLRNISKQIEGLKNDNRNPSAYGLLDVYKMGYWYISITEVFNLICYDINGLDIKIIKKYSNIFLDYNINWELINKYLEKCRFTIINKKLFIFQSDLIENLNIINIYGYVKKYFNRKQIALGSYVVDMEDIVPILQSLYNFESDEIGKSMVVKKCKKYYYNNNIYISLIDIFEQTELTSLPSALSKINYKENINYLIIDSRIKLINKEMLINFLKDLKTPLTIKFLTHYNIKSSFIDKYKIEYFNKIDIPENCYDKNMFKTEDIKVYQINENKYFINRSDFVYEYKPPIKICEEILIGSTYNYFVEASIYKKYIFDLLYKDLELDSFGKIFATNRNILRKDNKLTVIYKITKDKKKLPILFSHQLIRYNKEKIKLELKSDGNLNIINNVRFISINGECYFSLKDILKIFGLDTSRKANKIVLVKSNEIVSPMEVLSKNEFLNLIHGTKSKIGEILRKEMKIPLTAYAQKTLPRLEKMTIPIIENAFHYLNLERQYLLKNNNKKYFIDLAVLNYKIAIECDEDDHKGYDKDKELERELFLKQSGWTLIRYNPEEPETIGKAIDSIYNIISLHRNTI